MTGLPEGSQLIEDAYEKQGSQIAYVRSDKERGTR
jgi:hypothetical protein